MEYSNMTVSGSVCSKAKLTKEMLEKLSKSKDLAAADNRSKGNQVKMFRNLLVKGIY